MHGFGLHVIFWIVFIMSVVICGSYDLPALRVEADLIRLEQKMHPLKRELLNTGRGQVDCAKRTNCPFYVLSIV